MASRKAADQSAGTASRSRSRKSPAKSSGKSPKAKAKPAAEVVDPADCTHAWQISRPDSQISIGKCSKCGIEKEFLNYGEELRMPFGRRRRSS